MTLRQVQAEVDSHEYAEWVAFYTVEAEMSGLIDRPPTPDELGGKLRAFADLQNARVAAKVAKERP